MLNILSIVSFFEQLLPVFIMAHIGILNHSHSLYHWAMDIHKGRHDDGRWNLSGYNPLPDVILGSFKCPGPYGSEGMKKE